MRDPAVGMQIRAVRQCLGLSQRAFGKQLNITNVSVARYEAGRIPRLDVLRHIAAVGGVTVAWLLHGDKNQESHRRAPLTEQVSKPLRDLLRVATLDLRDLSAVERQRYERRKDEVIRRALRELKEYVTMLRATRTTNRGTFKR
jgi:transcriptional regulator with XRE-family HTH domain